MKIRILTPAQYDLVDSYWFYENRESGLGSYFIRSIYGDIESLQIYAGIHAKHLGKNRMIASTFPCSIFYLVEENEIRIYAVLDYRRDPDWMSKRLK
ncbi:MAG: type II toxin-antitoxin system RelE/ParE family toxin [Saprospiraceae bacterium]|nr:type II toxin-antitoxin system RelE/ParE family toxin [Pyrinomonadaceae bacterium]